MKVLFINTVYGKGSTGRIIRDIGQAVEKAGGQYMVAYGRGANVDADHSYRIGGTISVYIHALLSRITDKAGFYSKNATKALVKFIRGYDPDVIHLHNLHGYYINIEILFDYLKKEYKGKVVWTLHDCWAFTGHCVHYAYAGCDKWKTGCHNCPEKGRYPKSVFVDHSKKNYAKKKRLFTGLQNLTIVTPSSWLAKQANASFLGEYPCVMMNNGIDLSIFFPQPVEKNEKMLLNIADGLDERKGYRDLIALMEKLPEDYRLVMVGLKKKDLAKLPESIIPVLRTETMQELAKYYSQAEWFVNTTYEDTFPTVNIEALGCGTPIITYASGGSPEIIDETCGRVVAVGDVDAIAQIILENQPFAVEACVQRAQNFDKQNNYRKYINLYEETLKEKTQ